MRFGSAAHEDVHCGVVALRPTMDADMRFRQHRHAGDTVVRREVVQVDVKQRSTRCLNAFLECRLDVIEIVRSEEHTSELQSLMRISYAVFCLKKKNTTHTLAYYINCIAHQI